MSQPVSTSAQPTTHCPSCGRFVGPQSVCPYCGARVSRRLSLRVFQYGAAALALCGLFLLWVSARSADIPVVRVQDVGSAMNWAYVKMRGTVVRQPAYDAGSGYLRFWLDDGSGEIMVAAYRNESRALIEAGRAPTIGDVVTVEGTLKIQEDFTSLTLNVPEHVLVERPAPVEVTIGEMGLERLYQKVSIRGQVREVKQPYDGLTILTVRDETGEIDVTYTADLVLLSGEPAVVSPGDAVRVRGAVSLYGETVQITLDAADGLALLPGAVEIAAGKSIAGIAADDVGRMVQVEGAITEVAWMSAGQKFTLDDGTAQIALVLWQDVIDGLLDRADLRVGAWLRVRGIVTEYKGEIELAPELPLDVEITRVQPVEVTRLPLDQISAGQAGQVVSSEGQIVRAAAFSSGQKLVLQDGDARLAVVFWQDLFDACPDRDRLVAGAWVSVQGEVDTYQGEVELIPAHAGDVVFVEMRELPAVERRRVVEVTADDVGSMVEVEGVIVAVDALPSGQRWTLDDGTGQIAALLWDDVLAPLSMIFAAGTRVRVVGEVALYRGELEIVPALPGHVTWLDGGALPTATVRPTATLAPAVTPTATVRSTATPAPAATVTPTATVQPTATPAPVATETPAVRVIASGNLDAAEVDQLVRVKGTVVEAAVFAGGIKLYVDDGSGRAAVWVSQAVCDGLGGAAQLIVGSVVQVEGRVQAYKDELEVVPEFSTQVVVLVAAPTPEAAIARMGDLSAANVGETATVEGQIVEVNAFSKGVKCLLDDGSGRITLLLWQNIYDAVPEKERLVVGATVRARGKVDEYKGEIEVIPALGSDVEIK